MESSEIDSIMARQRELREKLDLLQDTWSDALIRQDAFGRIQDSDIDKMTENITRCKLGMCNLHDAIQGPLCRAIREPLIRARSTVQDETPVAGDSSTPSTRSEEPVTMPGIQDKTEKKESIPDISDQPSTSGVKEGELSLRPRTGKSEAKIDIFPSPSWQVYQSRWEKLCTRRGLNPSYCRVDTGGKYPRVWMLPGAKPQDVKEWYEFGALASVYTMAPAFTEIQDLPKWISMAVYNAWANNNSLRRGDVLELYFISAAPEPNGKGNYNAFHFITLRRPNNSSFQKIKEGDGVSAVSTFTEDQISTRRAWGLWVCLTEMGKVKCQFKFEHDKVKGSCMINTMAGRTSEYASIYFENKRKLLWENEIPGSDATCHKFCNMAHCNQWTDHICKFCPNQTGPEFGKGFGPRPDKRPARSSEHEEHRIPPRRQPRAPSKNARR